MYFYNNLFNPDVNRKIQNKKKRTKTTVDILLNELFVLDDQVKNEDTVQQYAQEQNITIT